MMCRPWPCRLPANVRRKAGSVRGARGRRPKAFFEQLPPGAAQRIEAVAIDMTTAYELEIRAHCPQAEVVFGLFHVVAKYGHEVIDRVRVQIQPVNCAITAQPGRCSNPRVGCRLRSMRRTQAAMVLPSPGMDREGRGAIGVRDFHTLHLS